MNTEATHDQNEALTTGARLRNAREQLGLSQQADLASTFLRGYIRSYARLVHIPEEELLPGLEKQAPLRAAKVAPMQSFSLGKRRKKRDGWLMTFTWLVLFVVIGLSGAWWWQDHKAQQEEITTMADQSSAELNNNQSQSVPLDTSTTTDQAMATTPTSPVDTTAGGQRDQRQDRRRLHRQPSIHNRMRLFHLRRQMLIPLRLRHQRQQQHQMALRRCQPIRLA